MFVRMENAHAFFRFYPVVSILVVLHVLIWFMFFLRIPIAEPLWEKMIGFNAAIKKGEYWRFISPLVLHVRFEHMIINSISLILFGPALEKMLGKGKFLLLYTGSGIFANVATFFLLPAMYSHAGASGAIFGLFGMYGYLVTFRRDIIEAQHARLLFAVLCISLFIAFTAPDANVAAHLFGFLGGGIIAPFISSHLHRQKPFFIR
ncbi:MULTISPECIES: rhomboid family intramembrane serine protease [Parageobacillus]|jgi:rhomboid protease GluP|uniref:Rhomboid family intramembrane serine protease n=1 Tax=Parageobacillus thermoglucosidasius TaxID=1426 RepID=A0A1B7KND5_PARTM|nr:MULTISPECIES: rhomboid family intramembrane serine protease [Parageobacillus]OAT71615.1 rhomboid family intramembrane serine protease [Parageobacillus thermoglucosidasius]BDG49034.1 putative rhomboid protease YdcA [Parageobacillus sp. KH3-4]